MGIFAVYKGHYTDEELLRMLLPLLLCGLNSAFCAFLPEKSLSPCYGVQCQNGGIIDPENCYCSCPVGFTGFLCEKELNPSKWPDGFYSLLSTAFGCPEPEVSGWTSGHINLTVAANWNQYQNYPEVFRLLGPYYHHSIQLNFCSRGINSSSSTTWPSGNYCLFKSNADRCPTDFAVSYLPLKDYRIWEEDVWGVIPDMRTLNEGVTLTICCRNDGIDKDIDLPTGFPFYLLKTSIADECQRVRDMVVTEEVFSFVKSSNRTWLHTGSLTAEESDTYLNITLCYYEAYERRECQYLEDSGASYRGRVNVTAAGVACGYWSDTKYPTERSYVGDYDLNYCRQTRYTKSQPQCIVDDKWSNCNIPYCDSSADYPNVISRKMFYSAPSRQDAPVKLIADGITGKPPFVVSRPFVEPWLQVYMMEDYEVHSVTIYKAYTWMPYNNRHIMTYVSRHRWDFLRFGAYLCDGPFNPNRNKKFRVQCRRPLIGSYVTIQNFVHHSPHFNEGQQNFFEVSEIVIRGRSTHCGKSLGIKSGIVKDFQLTSSTNENGYLAYHARLNRPTGWCAERTDANPYLQVDLLTPMTVEGVVIQGWTDGRVARIPHNFTLELGVREENLTAYTDNFGGVKIFKVDQTFVPSVSQTFLLRGVFARIIRIYLNQQMTPTCVKFDLLGCPKKVDFDLSCGPESTKAGLQVLDGHLFFQIPSTTRKTNVTDCQTDYMQAAGQFSSYRYSGDQCSYLPGNRYSRHNAHWWVIGWILTDQYGQLMCFKDISNIGSHNSNVTSPGDIFSPSYPFFYGENVNITWTVRFKEGQFISVEFIDVSLAVKETPYEDSAYFDCEDTLTIVDRYRDDDPIVAKITGYPFETLEGPRFISSSNEIEINLLSCHRMTETDARGFKLSLTAAGCSGCGQGDTSCSKLSTCRSSCGYISSPNFPNFYPVSSSCSWRIQGVKGQYVSVTFDMIDVIADEGCEGDYVSLYDLDLSERRSQSGTFCKLHRPIGEIMSSWHMLDVEFYSNSGNAGRGFLLKYNLKTIELSSIENNSSGDCEDDWFQYDDGCYGFMKETDGLSWILAEKRCNLHGGHLVSVGSPDEMLFLHSTILKNNMFTEQETYIGLRKIGSQEFRWSDGKPLTHTDWYHGDDVLSQQPDGLDLEQCTMLKVSSIQTTSNWHDVACAFDRVYQYICEVDINATTEQEHLLTLPAPAPDVEAQQGYFFKCGNREHISGLYVCDGIVDCSDGSDESNCTQEGCPGHMFTCRDGGCVDVAFYCDHVQHCDDGSDEATCVLAECGSDHWRCRSGQCVVTTQRCDLLVDCADGSDEEDCETCQSQFFQCYDGQCLPPGRVCDGLVDCGGEYREDEGPQCTTNSQPSCQAWHALGARRNGKYNINVEGSTVSHQVECVFNMTPGMVTTIIHHALEDVTVIGNTEFYEYLRYTVPHDVITYVTSSALTCRQRVQFDCLQAFDYYQYYISWLAFDGEKRSFLSPPGNNCSCILNDRCTDNVTRCACDRNRNELMVVDDNYWQTDSGYLDNKALLPITKVEIDDTLRLSRLRQIIGPLICEEPMTSTTQSLLCKSGVVVDSSHRCVLDYDVFNQPTGCRDLTHLQNCEDVTCPMEHVKCPESFCIPVRLVCDGHTDCADGSDEQHCVNTTCQGRFHCHGNSVCLPWQQVCDGIKHCPDGDDERYCNPSCPDACECEGSSIKCVNLDLRDITALPSYTRSLDVSRGLNKTLLNRTFLHMNQLAYLDMSNLGVHRLEEKCFHGLNNVLHLDLSMNFLEEIPENVFSSLENLKALLLAGNKLKFIYPGSFMGLVSLPYLDLSSMSLQSLVPGVFFGLKNMENLNVSGNSMTYVEDGSFAGVEHLRSLDLRDNQITRFSGGIFSGLDGLKSLYNDRFVFCCFKPEHLPLKDCFPEADEFSSCSDLMRNEALRISMWVLGFVALAGNILVIASRCIYDRRSLRKSNDQFVANLALSDFFMGGYMIMIASADSYYRGVYSLNDETWRSSWVCQMAGFLATLSGETSVMFLCMITLERVLVIRFPFKDFNFIQKSCKYICLAIWMIGVLFAGIPLLPLTYFSGSFYSRSGVCLALPLTRDRPPGWEYSTAIFVMWNFVCFVVIAGGQAIIYHAVKASQHLRMGQTSNDMAIARKLSFIVITDFVCWFPVCVMGLMALQGYVIGSEVYAWVAVFVLPINSALNPIIYTLSSIDTMRKRKIKRSQTVSSSVRSTVVTQSKTSVAKLMQREVLCLTPPTDSVCLTSYLGSVTSAGQILTIVQKLATSLDLLHSSSLVSRDITTDNIYLVLRDGIITKVVTACIPMATESEEDFCGDMLDFGHLVSKLLRAYTVSKMPRVKY